MPADRFAPGGVIFMAPAGSLSRGERTGIIEVKIGPDHLVVQPEPGAVLVLTDGHVASTDGRHVTVHADLMVHARGKSDRIPMLPPHQLGDDEAVWLLSLGAAPERFHGT